MYKAAYHIRFLSFAIGLFTVLTVNFGVAFAQDETRKTYRCTTKDAVSIMTDGTLNKEIGKAASEVFDKMVINLSTGNITFPSAGKVEKYIVAKISATDNDYVLFQSLTRRIDETTVANAVSRFIRVRAERGDPQPRFAAFALSYLVTGTCAIAP